MLLNLSGIILNYSENKVANRNYLILKNATVAVSLKYISNFWWSLSDHLFDLKLRWTKLCILASAGVENDNAYSNDIILLSKTQNDMFLSSL